MVKWELLPAACDLSVWDQALLQSQDYNIFQSFLWGEYKRTGGWTPMRWIARNGAGATIAMVQILVKTYPGNLKLGWAPGGPALFFPTTPRAQLPEILKELFQQKELQSSPTFIRFDSYLPSDETGVAALSAFCKRPRFAINTGVSSLIDLSQALDLLTAKMTAKHRYYVKKALGQNLKWKASIDISAAEDFELLHNEMTLQKKLPSIRVQPREISALLSALQTKARIFTGYLDDSVVSSCVVLTFGEKAFYLSAATSSEGRKIGASYAMIYRLWEYLKQEGITQLDFGGLNPGSPSARGVDHFKKGFGGSLVQHLGEWEWSTDEWLRWGFNLAVWFRGRKL